MKRYLEDAIAEDLNENMVASNLLKFCHHTEDVEGDSMELRFIRDAQCPSV